MKTRSTRTIGTLALATLLAGLSIIASTDASFARGRAPGRGPGPGLQILHYTASTAIHRMMINRYRLR
jgi:hypothetical protein